MAGALSGWGLRRAERNCYEGRIMALLTGGMPPPIDDELLSAWLDGAVSPAERAAVEAAIAADPAVRMRATDLRATVALVRELPQPAPRRTFILTPEQAAAIRPARGAWITRLFPTIAAASAVAAVLCLALIAGDLATGAFSMKQRMTPRPITESVPDATVTRATVAPAVPTAAPAAPAGAAAIPPGTTAAGSAASVRGPNAPSVAAAAIAPTAAGGIINTVPPLTPTVGSFAASTIALPTTPTIVANAPPPPPIIGASPLGGATVIQETHRVPVALVRGGEILLALLALAGLALALAGWRAKTRRG
jgi:anti-sigma factor RsiW